MPVRHPPVTERASRVLLEGLIDYAGLFPPASASMPVAVRNYAHYRASGSAWMLGRFVCSVKDLDEFSSAAEPLLPRDAGAIPWRLSAIGSGNAADDAAAIAAFNTRHRVCFDECGAIVDSYETRVSTVDDVREASAAFGDRLTPYLEVSLGDDMVTLLDAIGEAGCRAKVRTGGVTAGAFPSTAQVVAFLGACATRGVACKATAGLHHALCGSYPLTYAPEAASAPMYGYLNVVLAAGLLAAGAGEQVAARMLEESDASTLQVDELEVAWRGDDQVFLLDRELVSRVRRQLLISVGSCSFTEPVDEARALGLT